MMKKHIRLLSALLAAVLLMSCMPGVMAYGKASNWAKPELDRMENLGLIPESMETLESLTVNATRSQMCDLVVLVYETHTGQELAPENETPFPDTDSLNVAKAYSLGLVSGYGDGNFGPDDTLTREQFCVIAYRLLEALGAHPDGSAEDTEYYLDADQVSKWSKDAVWSMVRYRILQGSAGNLNLKNSVSVEQSLVLLCRIYERLQADGFATRERLQGAASWATKQIQAMDQEGLIPNLVLYDNLGATITRKEICYVAVRAYFAMNGMPFSETRPSPFKDAADPVITAAYYLGVMSGYGDGRFGPDDPVTREQLFTITANFLMVNYYDRIDAPNANVSQFSDWNQVSDFAKSATRLLVDMGVVQGGGGYLYPKNTADRQSALLLFYRAYLAYNQWVEDSMNPPEPPAPDPLGQQIADYAKTFVGYPYTWAGSSPSTGFDCSGLVVYVYSHFNIKMYHGATGMWNGNHSGYPVGVSVSTSNLQPGDLLFFSNDGGESMFHVAIYIGNNQYVHAANSTRGVVIDTMNWTSGSWFAKNYWGAKRFI